jgi:hypothetical protein
MNDFSRDLSYVAVVGNPDSIRGSPETGAVVGTTTVLTNQLLALVHFGF